MWEVYGCYYKFPRVAWPSLVQDFMLGDVIAEDRFLSIGG